MPEVYVHAIEGRSKEQKRALIKDITDAVVKNFGVTADAVLVEILESSRDNKAKGGVLFSERGTATASPVTAASASAGSRESPDRPAPLSRPRRCRPGCRQRRRTRRRNRRPRPPISDRVWRARCAPAPRACFAPPGR